MPSHKTAPRTSCFHREEHTVIHAHNSQTASRSIEQHASHSARRRMTRVALTAALLAPISLVGFSSLRAETPIAPGASAADSVNVILASMQPQASSDDLLQRGAQELKNKQYEEALATLQQVDAKNW